MMEEAMLWLDKSNYRLYGVPCAIIILLAGDFNCKLSQDGYSVGKVSNPVSNIRADPVKILMYKLDVMALNTFDHGTDLMVEQFGKDVMNQTQIDWTSSWLHGPAPDNDEGLDCDDEPRLVAGPLDHGCLELGANGPPAHVTHCHWSSKTFRQIDYILCSRTFAPCSG